MESCTGGLFASAITDVPGSGYLLGAAVTYSNDAKQRLGVDARVLAECGAVSAETAAAMASAATHLFGADYGVGITGVAGPDPQEGYEPGVVFAAVFSSRTGQSVVRLLECVGERPAIKAQAAQHSMELVLETVLMECGPGASHATGKSAK